MLEIFYLARVTTKSCKWFVQKRHVYAVQPGEDFSNQQEIQREIINVASSETKCSVISASDIKNLLNKRTKQ